jgi:hypothetical protein
MILFQFNIQTKVLNQFLRNIKRKTSQFTTDSLTNLSRIQ